MRKSVNVGRQQEENRLREPNVVLNSYSIHNPRDYFLEFLDDQSYVRSGGDSREEVDFLEIVTAVRDEDVSHCTLGWEGRVIRTGRSYTACARISTACLRTAPQSSGASGVGR